MSFPTLVVFDSMSGLPRPTARNLLIPSEMATLKNLKHSILYLRGLNTYGDDDLRLGPLAFGLMWRPWIHALSHDGLTAIPISGLGGSTLEDQVRHAVQFIRDLPLWKNSSEPIHLLGHSTGGLIARALVHELKSPQRILSVATMATPHQGTPLALLPLNLKKQRPHLDRILRTFGYRSETKIRPLDDLTPQATESFNQRYSNLPKVEYGAVVFTVPRNEMSWPIQIANRALDPNKSLGSNDGFVPENSQVWGKTICRSHLDHLEQIGFSLSPNPWRRRRMTEELGRIREELLRFWSQSENR